MSRICHEMYSSRAKGRRGSRRAGLEGRWNYSQVLSPSLKLGSNIYRLFRPKVIAKILGTMINSCTSSAIGRRGFFAVSNGFAAFSRAMISVMLSFLLLSILSVLRMPICEYTLNFPKDKKAIELFSHFLYNQISRGEVLAPLLSIHIFIKEENQYEEVSCIAAVYDSGPEPNRLRRRRRRRQQARGRVQARRHPAARRFRQRTRRGQNREGGPHLHRRRKRPGLHLQLHPGQGGRHRGPGRQGHHRGMGHQMEHRRGLRLRGRQHRTGGRGLRPYHQQLLRLRALHAEGGSRLSRNRVHRLHQPGLLGRQPGQHPQRLRQHLRGPLFGGHRGGHEAPADD